MKLSEIKEKYNTLLKSMKICKDNDFYEPVLILVYATIDSLSWLNSLEKEIEKRNGKKEFKEFVEKYILEKLKFAVTSEELYNARCAIVHTMSSRSQHNFNKNIRIISYSNNELSKNIGNELLKIINQEENVICIDVINLLKVLVDTIDDFFTDVENDKNKERIVIEKAKEYYSIFNI